METTTQAEPVTCGCYLPGLPPRKCTSTAIEYRTDSYMEHDECDRARKWRQYRAIRVCNACGARSVVDVSPDVPRAGFDRAQWAAWWATIDARE